MENSMNKLKENYDFNGIDSKMIKSDITNVLLKDCNIIINDKLFLNDSVISMAGISYTINSSFLHSIDSTNNLIIKYYDFLSIPFTNHNNDNLLKHLRYISSKFQRKIYLDNAIDSCKTFIIPKEVISNSIKEYNEVGSLDKLLIIKHLSTQENRFNSNLLYSDNSEFINRLDLSENGIFIPIQS